MSEIPSPTSAAPTSSVVVDSNVRMPSTNRGLIAAIAVAAVLVAAFVVWLVTAGDGGTYEPGPVAQALVKSFEKSGAKVDLSNDELRCIDDKGKDIDPKTFENESIDVLGNGGDMPDEKTLAAVGVIFDDCLQTSSRVELFSSSFKGEDGKITDEQATCIATAFDKAFVDAGGYEKVFGQGEQAMGSMVMSIFGSLMACGVDLGDLGG